MKKLIGIIALLAAAYTGFWFYGVSKARDELVHAFSDCAKNCECEISYDSVSTSGYPLNFQVHFENPRCKAVANNVNVWSLAGTATVASDPAGRAGWLLVDGTVTSAYNILTIKGKHRVDVPDIQALVHIFFRSESLKIQDFFKQFEMDSNDVLVTLRVPKDSETVEIAMPIKGFHLETKDLLADPERLRWRIIASIDQDTHAQLPANLFTSTEQQAGVESLILEVYLREVRALHPGASKQTMDLEFDLPAWSTMTSYVDQPVNLLLNFQPMAFKMRGTASDAACSYDVSYNGSVSKDDEGQLLFSYSQHVSLQATEMATRLVQQTVRGVIDALPRIQAPKGDLDEAMVTWWTTHKDEVVAAIPAFETLGKLTADFVIDGTIPVEAFAGKGAISLHLRNFGMQSARGGVTLGGDTSFVPYPGLPGETLSSMTAKMKLNIHSVDRLIHDSAAGYNQIAQLVNTLPDLAEEDIAEIIPDEAVKQFITFLRHVASEPEATDLQIPINFQQPGGFTFNGKSPEELMFLWFTSGMPATPSS